MAKLEELFSKYSERALQNVIKGEFTNLSKDSFKKYPIILELVQIEGKEFLFRCEDKPVRIKATNEVTLKPEITPEGTYKYNYFFWITENDFGDKTNIVLIHFLKCGNIESHTEIDIAYGDDVVFYMTQRGQKTTNLDIVPSILAKWFTFSTSYGRYMFIETFPNSDSNFRIHGLNGQTDIMLVDGRWIASKVTKKKFPNKYDDFLLYKVVKYKTINFVDKLLAREAFDTISLRDSTSGDTVISLWKEYSRLEEKKAIDYRNKLGKIHFTSANQKKEGVTTIKLDPNEEQREIILGDLDEFLNASFSITDGPEKVSFKSYDRYGNFVTIVNEEYPIRQGASGYLEVDIKGNEAVKSRRDYALHTFDSRRNLALINLRLAIEGVAESMIPKPRKEKILSAKTKIFIKEKFGIDDLTEDQKKAVYIAINTPDIAVIQGPPGTGKSTVVAVICQRLIELSEKGKPLDKVILVSAFQNDTVEHIASKIETFGLPTIKVGKDVQGVRSEEGFITKMRNSIDNAIHHLAPEYSTMRISQQLASLKALLEKENNPDGVKAKINELINLSDLDEGLFVEWKKLYRKEPFEHTDKDKAINAIKGLRTTPEAYSDDGYKKIRRACNSGINFTQEELNLLENAPIGEEEITEEFLEKLKELQAKYLAALYETSNEVAGGIDISLTTWIDEAIDFFKTKEENSYADMDTFLTVTLNNLRDDLFGNSDHIRSAIQHYGQSVAATNQYAGSLNVNNLNYENVILEEAARSNPLDLLIPMVRASERIILVGDQNQLPHLLENDIVDEAVKDDAEKKKKYKESLFSIIFKNLEYANPIRRITLSNQFRMHPVIGDFISKTYYKDAISSKMVDVRKKMHNLSISWAKDKVAVFCDVPKYLGMETRCGKSKERLAEAKRIVELLNELRSDSEFDNLSIGIITFYSKQVDVICKEAENFGYTEAQGDGSYRISPAYQITPDGREKLRIGSVDSFQGKEFDIVILSTVRSNTYLRIDENNLKIFGFLTLENRLNVAFSRAQKMIITVGDGEMFVDELAETYVKGIYEFYTNLCNSEYGNKIK